MTHLDWVFDPLPPSGARQGGNPALHVFRADLETFVREVLQNARDQRVTDTAPVKVSFTFNQLNGPAKVGLLQAIGWPDLRPHVAGASGSTGIAQVARTLSDGLGQMDDEPLLVLRIDDSGTLGLVGGEDDQTSNYNGLCRNTLVSQDRPERGGSYGLGKAVLWRFSSIFTVLFSSRIDGPPRQGVRLFGRSELPYHKVGDEGFCGVGWFGEQQLVSGGRRAISAWDNAAGDLTAPTGLYRDPLLGTGTSILVVGFREPQQEGVRPAVEIAKDIATLTARWFWPAIERGQLQVQVAVQENGHEVFALPVTLTPEVEGYAQAVATAGTGCKQPPLAPGDVAEVELPFTVPGRRPSLTDAGTSPVAGQVLLRVRRMASPAGLANRVALTRGAGIVVQYRPVRGIAHDRAFQAVVLAGLARGDSPADTVVEAFLRAAEPPAHDEWQATPRVRSEYRPGFAKALTDLWQAVDVHVSRLFAEQVADDAPGPDLLARRFRVAGVGDTDRVPRPVDPASDGKIKVKNLMAVFNGEVWRFEGTVARVGPSRPWNVRIGLALAEENGQGTPVAIDQLAVSTGTNQVQVRGLDIERSLQIAADCAEVTFSGCSHFVTTAADSQTAKRTRLNVTVRPGSRG